MARAQPGVLLPRGAGAHSPIQLDQDVTTLGRSPSCGVVVPLPTVSRLHARIEVQHDRYMLFDSHSANGTFVNGSRIDEGMQLSTGDEIWLGTSEAAFGFVDPDETVQVTVGQLPAALRIDATARTVSVYGAAASLTPLEYSLLDYLAANPGTVCTREACFLAVWGQPYDQATCEDALNACIARLRRTLRAAAEHAGHTPPPITTIPRVGFRLDADVVFAPRATPLPPLREHPGGS
jgi:DNA-binding response OmpR family regulator